MKQKKQKSQARIIMTNQQMIELEPLLKKIRKSPGKYAIIGQVINGVGMFAVFTPELLIERGELLKLERDTITPA